MNPISSKHLLLAALCVGSSLAFAQTPATAVVSKAADNSEMNQRDKSAATIKPTDQPENAADIKVAAAVRHAIVGDKGLSTMAHNVKLVAVAGVVTLRGPVANATEKARINTLVAAVPGVTRVDDQLDIKQ